MIDRRWALVVNAGFSLSLVLLATLASLTYRNLASTRNTDDEVYHAHAVIHEFDRFLSMMKDAETGQRGFLITGKTIYLQPYAAALGEIKGSLASLRNLTIDNRRQQERLARIGGLVDKKLAELDRAIVLRRTNGFAAASEALATDRGKAVMDEIRVEVAASEEMEEKNLKAQIDAKSSAADRLIEVLVVGRILSFSMLLLIFLVLKREISRRLSTEGELREFQDHLSQLVDGRTQSLVEARDQVTILARLPEENPDPVLRVSVDGTVIYRNRAAGKLAGWECEVGRPLPRQLKHLVEQAVDKVGLINAEGDFGGRSYLFLITPFPEDSYVNFYGRDITEHKLAEEALRRSEKDIARLSAEKMAALAAEAAALRSRERMAVDLMANLSHEIRTPLTAIKGYAEALRRGGLEDVENRLDFVQTIESHADRLSNLVEEMLFMSDLDSQAENPRMEFETTDLANVVAECVRKLAPVGKAAGSRRLEVDVAAGLIVRANVDHLTAILQNLLDNAFKYNRPGGGVSIAARVDGTSAVVTVRDTGRGISKADLGLVFNRFYRARATKHIRGTGLGLPIVKGIVELYGGRIWVESVYRKGSAFHFTLPLAG